MIDILTTIILSAAPISELRGGITYAVAKGIDFPISFILPVFVNMLVIPIIFVMVDPLFTLFKKLSFLRKFIEKYEARAKRKIDKYEKYKIWGLFLFVAVPLPTTGVYTGIVASILIGMSPRKAAVPLIAGVFVAGIITYLTVISAGNIFSLF